MYDFKCVEAKLALVREGKKGDPSIVALLWSESCRSPEDGKGPFALLHCLRIAVCLEPEKKIIQSYLIDCEAAIADGLHNINHYLLGDSISHCSQGDVLGTCEVQCLTSSPKRSFTPFLEVFRNRQSDDQEV